MDNMPQTVEWEAQLESKLESLRQQRNEIMAEIERLTKKLDLLRQLRALDETSAVEPSVPANEIEAARATPSGVREATRRILAEASEPLHISQIHRAFVQNGYAIPGKGTAFNILAHIVNDKAFVRVARGTYALAGSVPQEQVLPRSPRIRRRKRRATRRNASSEGK